MSGAEPDSCVTDVDRYLAGAARMMASVRYCWLATHSDGGDFGIRPMGLLPKENGDPEWTMRFLTDGRSRKAGEIRRDPRVAVMFLHDANDASVKVSGLARLLEDPSYVQPRWKSAYNRVFPTEEDRASAAFVQIEFERMELWIRGVTPEPWGVSATVLERNRAGNWRLVPARADRASERQVL